MNSNTLSIRPMKLLQLALLAVFLITVTVACQQNGESPAAPGTSTEASLSESGADNSSAAAEECTVKPPKDALERMCTQQYDPVCGCNDVTYSNACMAGIAGVSSSTPGACEEDRSDRS